MKNTIGNSVALTLFGESHGSAIGAVLDGLAPGIPVDSHFIASQLELRRPAGKISTARVESDPFIIESGVFNGYTTGTPICILIPNENTRSGDYLATRPLARPGHADYTAYCKYHGYEDYRGGGHFSGRITAAAVAAGAIAIAALQRRGIFIGTHIARLGGVCDRQFMSLSDDINALNQMQFAALDSDAAEGMQAAITAAAADGDSVGGCLETAVIGLPSGVGEPFFDTLEGLLAHALFAIPAVKGVEFGSGFGFADMRGSEANDRFLMRSNAVETDTNNNGGINGGISNGMPIILRSAIKPTPSISKQQSTVNFIDRADAELAVKGRHDPCIVHRARVVVDSLVAIVLADALSGRYGTDWLVNG